MKRIVWVDVGTHFAQEYESAFGDYTRAYLINIAGAMTAVAGGMLAGGGVTLLATSNTRIDANGAGVRVHITLPQRGVK